MRWANSATDGHPMLLTFYGDDFTGSTDAMEVLEWGGVRTLLFLEPPSLEFLDENFPLVDAVGVAGASRSMTPSEMDTVLPRIFKALGKLGAPIVHYKVCSTFDSSPEVGSIGHAIDIGIETFGGEIVPVVVGAPFLGRYVAFSNLFASQGDNIYRIDRHPTMSKHPSTPMSEGDLRLHLGQQTARRIASIDLLQLVESPGQIINLLERLQSKSVEIAVFDTAEENHLVTIGGILHARSARRPNNQPQLVVGSSGVEKALSLLWQANGIVEKPVLPPLVGAVKQIIVMSGSAAPRSAEQIRWAQAHGFAAIRLNAAKLVDPDFADRERAEVVESALMEIVHGRSVILFSTLGSDDPALMATKDQLDALGIDPHLVSRILGKQQGLILRELLERSQVRRVVVAGGDTCSYTVQQLGIIALRAASPISPGAPLCRAYTSSRNFDGLEIALKGGQIGQPDYFDQIRRGCP